MKRLFRKFGNYIRAHFVKRITFTGDFADVLAQRRKWVKENEVLIIGIEDYRKQPNRKGKLKNNTMTVLYVDDNPLMYFIGFKKNFVHQLLTRR